MSLWIHEHCLVYVHVVCIKIQDIVFGEQRTMVLTSYSSPSGLLYARIIIVLFC